MSDPLAIPSPWIRRFAALVPSRGAVLDVAAGGGRHSRFFLERRHPVTAIDRNLTGMADLQGRDGLELIEADLESADRSQASPPPSWPPGDRRFAAVVVVNYLFRPLLPRMVAAVEAEGVLLYETFAVGNEAFGRPASPDYLLRPGELLAACDGLQVVAYEHGVVYTPRPAVVSRIAAVRASGPRSL